MSCFRVIDLLINKLQFESEFYYMKKFLIIDIIIFICSLISSFIFYSPIDLGFTIPQTIGFFAISFSVLIISIFALLLVLIIFFFKQKQLKKV